MATASRYVSLVSRALLLVVSLAAAVVAARYADDARSSLREARKTAEDVRTVNITVSITGTDAASRATAEKVVKQLKALEPVAISAESYRTSSNSVWH